VRSAHTHSRPREVVASRRWRSLPASQATPHELQLGQAERAAYQSTQRTSGISVVVHAKCAPAMIAAHATVESPSRRWSSLRTGRARTAPVWASGRSREETVQTHLARLLCGAGLRRSVTSAGEPRTARVRSDTETTSPWAPPACARRAPTSHLPSQPNQRAVPRPTSCSGSDAAGDRRQAAADRAQGRRLRREHAADCSWRTGSWHDRQLDWVPTERAPPARPRRQMRRVVQPLSKTGPRNASARPSNATPCAPVTALNLQRRRRRSHRRTSARPKGRQSGSGADQLCKHTARTEVRSLPALLSIRSPGHRMRTSPT
jgi:hypothetical protein